MLNPSLSCTRPLMEAPSSALCTSCKSHDGPNFDANDEDLLFFARNGSVPEVNDILHSVILGKSSININCKGKKKGNRGWTPLHLAAYFGHVAVVRSLLKAGVDVNAINMSGDTALHRASFTGREEVVRLLLDFGADIFVVNSEGFLPRDVACNNHIIAMLDAILMSYFGQSSASNSTSMEQLLAVQPIKTPRMWPLRFEGPLAKKCRFIGFRRSWAVLDCGVLSYFRTCQDANSVSKRKSVNYLHGAQIKVSRSSPEVRLQFSNGDVHLLSVAKIDGDSGYRQVIEFDCGDVLQRWVDALSDHISYGANLCASSDQLKDTDEVLSVGDLRQILQAAQRCFRLFAGRVGKLQATVEKFQSLLSSSNHTGVGSRLSSEDSSASHHAQSVQNGGEGIDYIFDINDQAVELQMSMCAVLLLLSRCMVIFSRQEEARHTKFNEIVHQCNALQEALRVLTSRHDEPRHVEKNLPIDINRSSDDTDTFHDCEDDDFFASFGWDSQRRTADPPQVDLPKIVRCQKREQRMRHD